MVPLRQITTYPSRTVIAALEDRQCRHQGAAPTPDPETTQPSNTDYAIQVIARHGLLVGGSKACWRAVRTMPAKISLPVK